MISSKEKAKELFNKMDMVVGGGNYDAKEYTLIAVKRNIEIFTELVNKMDDFSNESRQVIFQLIEDEEQVEKEINKL